jgi:hypothetical protein
MIAFVGFVALLFLTHTSQAQDQRRGGADHRRPSSNMLSVGQVAPDFELPKLESVVPSGEGSNTKHSKKGTGDKIKLSSFRGKKPVFVIFSSYT